MTFTKRLLLQLHHTVKRRYSLKNIRADDLLYVPKFSEEEQHKILRTVNESSADELSRYSVSASRIKNLQTYKSKKGPFHSLNDILEVDGLGIKALEKICENIIHEKVTVVPEKKIKNGSDNKRLKNLLMPPLVEDDISRITSAVGLHLEPTGMSWAKLSREQNKLVSWGSEDFSSLPTKMLPTDTYYLAQNMLQKIPVADIYVLESTSKNIQGQNQTVISSHHLELSSMLLVLLNTSALHNLSTRTAKENEILKSPPNVVHFVKSNIPARLFKTFIGNEKVSTVQTITTLLNSSTSQEEFILPCSKIVLESKILQEYTSKAPPTKELLGQALMLVITFMDIWIYKNATSIAEIISHNNRKQLK